MPAGAGEMGAEAGAAAGEVGTRAGHGLPFTGWIHCSSSPSLGGSGIGTTTRTTTVGYMRLELGPAS
eukprot:1037834-Pyramimonas_sp.AAC.1